MRHIIKSSSCILTPVFPTQLWTPPTPPQDDNDIYIDSVMMLMYDTTPMPESKLPPVYIRKEHKRLKMDPSGGRSSLTPLYNRLSGLCWLRLNMRLHFIYLFIKSIFCE